MNKKVVKIMSAVMVVIMMIVAVSPVFALVKPEDVKATSTTSDSQITAIGSKVLSIITTIGIVVSVVVIAGLGIKYITGSAEEKAEYKKSLLPLLVGMILLLGASSIAKFLVDAAKATNS